MVRGLVVTLALFGSGSALAADCIARVSGTPSLASCVATVRVGGEIELEDGVHKVATLDIARSMTIRAQTPGAAAIQSSAFFPIGTDLAWTTSGGLATRDPVIRARGLTTKLVVDGVELRPSVGIVQGAPEPLVHGRAVVVEGAEVTLRDVALTPWGSSSSASPSTALRAHSTFTVTEDVDPQEGGMLAHVSASGRLLVEGGTVRGVKGSTLVGAAIFASGPGAEVTITGRMTMTDGDAAAGAVAAVRGATLTIGDLSGSDEQPTFEALTGLLGGAVLVSGGEATVFGGVFAENGHRRRNASVPESCGGHLAAIERSRLRIEGGRFRDGHAAQGGSICAVAANVEITGGAFSSAAARDGGHLYVAGVGLRETSVLVHNATLENGEVALTPAERSFNSTVPMGERFVPRGGALLAAEATVAMAGALLRGNGGDTDAVEGGAIAVFRGEVGCEACVFAGNRAADGGGVWSALSDGTWIDTSFEGNSASGAGGGLLHFGGTLSFEGGRVAANAATIGAGAAIATNAEARFNGTTFRGGRARDGGGVAILAKNAIFSGVTFEDGVATDGVGGHLFGYAGTWGDEGVVRGDLTLRDVTMTGGRAAAGGSIAVDGMRTVIEDTRVEDSVATVDGGAVWITGSQQVTLARVTLRDAAAGMGGGLHVSESQVVSIEDSTISANRADLGGGVAIVASADVFVRRTTLCDNLAEQGAAVFLGAVSGPSGAVVQNNLIHGGAARSTGLVVGSNTDLTFEQNAVIGGAGRAIGAIGGSVVSHHNLYGWTAAGNLGEALIELDDVAVWITEGDAFWSPDGEPVIRIGGDLKPFPSDAVLDAPHVRGGLRDTAGVPGCSSPDLHPRPTSPLLRDGWPAGPDDRVVGPFGGAEADPTDWVTDADEDGSPRIFDCDDADPALPERLTQFVDGDGDGVGDALDDGDDCTLLAGHVTVGGDCDDADPRNTAICGESIGYYGTRCDAAGGAAGWAWLLLGAALLRRRR